MRKITFGLLLVVLSLVMTSCWVYRPQLADIPLIDHRGDMRLSCSVNANPLLPYKARIGRYLFPVPGVSSTFSAGLTDKAAVQLYSDLQGEILYSHAAAGLYKSYGGSVLEGYLGIGCGHGHIYIDAEPASSDVYYICPFVQVNYGWHLGVHWDAGVSMKTGDWIPFKIRGAEGESHPSQAPLLEPQLFVRVGGENTKFLLQVGYTYLVGWPNSHLLRYFPVTVGMGLSFVL